MADEDGLVGGVGRGVGQALGEGLERGLAAPGLGDVLEGTGVVHVHDGLDLQDSANKGRRCIDAAAALEEHQVIDREPVAKMRDGLADEVRDLVHRRAGLLLLAAR